MTILVTGSAGFIGYNTAKKLLERGDNVVGVDNFYPYYDVKLKQARHAELLTYPNFKFGNVDISDLESIKKVFEENKIDKVCHLAAQAGVRFSIDNPYIYQKSNIEGFINVITLAKDYKVINFVYASSSSVYGANTKYPYSETDRVDEPVSLYATTKRANELMAFTYNKIFGLKVTGLRFFTVYGPMGRPDMAYFNFAKDIVAGNTINVFNNGNMKRDFTYVDDIVNGVVASIDAELDCEVFNLGNNNPEELGTLISLIEKNLGIEARKNFMPMQKGDVLETYADISKAQRMLGYQPTVNLDEGIRRFIVWYKDYFKV